RRFLHLTVVLIIHVINILLALAIGGVMGHWLPNALVVFIVAGGAAAHGVISGSETSWFVAPAVALVGFVVAAGWIASCMCIAVARQVRAGEGRVAATPDTVKRMKALGADVVVQAGAGTASGILDADYEAAGATIAPTIQEAVRDADVVLKVRRPSEAEVR